MVVVCALKDARERETKAVGVRSFPNEHKAFLGIKLQNVAFVFATFEETKTYRREKRRARERTFLKMSTLGPRLHAIALKALEFPRILSPSFTKDVCVASVYSSETSREYRELVLWLENTKIRKLKREGGEREKLLSETLEDEAWSKNYEAYLKACECDETHLTCAESKIDFLINLALAEEYRDRFDIAEEEEEKEEKEEKEKSSTRIPLFLHLQNRKKKVPRRRTRSKRLPRPRTDSSGLKIRRRRRRRRRVQIQIRRRSLDRISILITRIT